MRRDSTGRRVSWSLAVAIAVALAIPAASAVARAQDRRPGTQKGAPPPLVWPQPPESPRVRYITAFHGATDFKTKRPSRWKAALLGNAPDLPTSDDLVKPYAMAVSKEGRIYVTDTATRRVFAIDRDRRTLMFIGERGSTTLAKPVGVAVDAGGQLFVSDATLKRVFGFSPEGDFLRTIGRDGDFDSPAGLAVDRTRQLLYVIDSSRHRIVCFSTVDGSVVRTIGKRGGEPGEFNFPTNLFVDRTGRLYVADTLNFRVQVLEADGTFLRMFGTLGDAPGTFNRPKGIAVDSEGHIYVADGAFNNFQIFDHEGQLLLFVGHGGVGPGEFMLPASLHVDERDQIYVADQGNARVQVFQYLRQNTK